MTECPWYAGECNLGCGPEECIGYVTEANADKEHPADRDIPSHGIGQRGVVGHECIT